MNGLRKINWFLTQQVGIDVRRLLTCLVRLPRYIADTVQFRRHYQGRMSYLPCLHDRFEQGGEIRNEYFTQDLYVAQKVVQNAPRNHADVGSRIDGFVAHVAASRRVTVLDIRPVDTEIQNVTFRQADLMAPAVDLAGQFDCVSCLHTLEHFGLGRYGDPLDANGHLKGLTNVARLAADGGTLYISVPVGAPKVEFNAHRICSASAFVEHARSIGLSLLEFATVTSGGTLTLCEASNDTLRAIDSESYLLGLFAFRKAAGMSQVR